LVEAFVDVDAEERIVRGELVTDAIESAALVLVPRFIEA